MPVAVQAQSGTVFQQALDETLAWVRDRNNNVHLARARARWDADVAGRMRSAGFETRRRLAACFPTCVSASTPVAYQGVTRCDTEVFCVDRLSQEDPLSDGRVRQHANDEPGEGAEHASRAA